MSAVLLADARDAKILTNFSNASGLGSLPESAELIDDQDKTGAPRKENVIAEKLNEFFALIHAHSGSNWEISMRQHSSGKAHHSHLSKTEVITNNFKEQTDKTNSNQSPRLDDYPTVQKELIN